MLPVSIQTNAMCKAQGTIKMWLIFKQIISELVYTEEWYPIQSHYYWDYSPIQEVSEFLMAQYSFYKSEFEFSELSKVIQLQVWW